MCNSYILENILIVFETLVEQFFRISLLSIIKFTFSWIKIVCRGGSWADATFKIECFVLIVNSCKPLTIITKHSILDVVPALDLPLVSAFLTKIRFWILFFLYMRVCDSFSTTFCVWRFTKSVSQVIFY